MLLLRCPVSPLKAARSMRLPHTAACAVLSSLPACRLPRRASTWSCSCGSGRRSWSRRSRQRRRHTLCLTRAGAHPSAHCSAEQPASRTIKPAVCVCVGHREAICILLTAAVPLPAARCCCLCVWVRAGLPLPAWRRRTSSSCPPIIRRCSSWGRWVPARLLGCCSCDSAVFGAGPLLRRR